jgi:hypothetical protein
VQENAHVQFPGVKNDTFSLGALAKVSDSSSAAELLADPNGKAKDEITEAVDHVINKLLSGIQTEALISTVIIAIWLLVAIGGLLFACIFLSRDKSSGNYDPYIINPALVDNPHTEKSQEYPDTAAPPYEGPVNKAAPYTLQGRPFPTYGPTDNDQSETVRQVDAHIVAESARPGHQRVSSYGHLADPSPSDEKSNPFIHPDEKNPFAG